MSKVFNSVFEVSLRLLILLSENENKEMTLDRIAAFDYMAIYGSSFGVADTDLHGENEFGMCEFPTRRSSAQAALKELVLQGLIKVRKTQNGFEYCISDTGIKLCAGLKSDYAAEYRKRIASLAVTYKGKTDVELLGVLTRTSAKSLRR